MMYWKRYPRLISILTLSAIAMACTRTPFNPDYEQSLDGLGLTVRANQAYFEYGAPIAITLEVVNLTNKKKHFHLADGRTIDCVIMTTANESVWRHSNVYGALLLSWTFTLKAHQQKSYVSICEDTLDAGLYRAEGWFIFHPSLRDTTGFIVLDGASK